MGGIIAKAPSKKLDGRYTMRPLRQGKEGNPGEREEWGVMEMRQRAATPATAVQVTRVETQAA